MGDEIIAAVRTYLATHDPDVLAAVADVDRSLIRSELQLSPLTRLVASAQQARFMSGWLQDAKRSRCFRSDRAAC